MVTWPKIKRSQSEMLEALKEHRDLLREYHDRACMGGDNRFLGEVAGKLRLLVLKTGRNRPLLLDLMVQFGADVTHHRRHATQDRDSSRIPF
jgi:hypothetical protein